MENGGSEVVKNVRFYGNKPYKVAVVHGGPGALGSVAAIARELSKDVGVIEPLQTRDSISELLIELDEVIVASGDQPLTLIGHSWGAWFVFLYAARYPEKVRKIILVGSGPFEVEYIAEISKTRMKHLSKTECEEFDKLLKRLDSDQETKKDELLKRLGELVDKSDNYCTFEIETDKDDWLPAEGDKYSVIWKEAAVLRETGELLSLADQINCSVIAIHGEYDPHPIDGVKMPLANKVKDFHCYSLNKCGHNPWKEKYAYQEFYEILRKELKSNITEKRGFELPQRDKS